jgi:hypothetical protein
MTLGDIGRVRSNTEQSAKKRAISEIPYRLDATFVKKCCPAKILLPGIVPIAASEGNAIIHMVGTLMVAHSRGRRLS